MREQGAAGGRARAGRCLEGEEKLLEELGLCRVERHAARAEEEGELAELLVDEDPQARGLVVERLLRGRELVLHHVKVDSPQAQRAR